MFSNKLSTLIEKDETTIACKKRAKELFRAYKENSNKQSLMQCQSIAAVELGFKDWFDLQNNIKKKHEFQIKVGYDILADDFHQLLLDAIDGEYIHIEVREQVGYIRIRKEGIFNFYKKGNAFTTHYLNDLCNTIVYEIGNTNCSNIPFDFKKASYIGNQYSIIDKTNKVRNFFFGVQSVPAYPNGYDLVIKLVPQFTKRTLQNSGFEECQIHDLLSLVSKPTGTLLIAGVTGSGKSTTMKSLLTEINSYYNYTKKIYTIESPIEYKIEHTTQINVEQVPYDNKISMYDHALEQCFKNSADIIMLSELRNRLSGQAFEKASKNAFLMSTIPASSALDIILRLKDFDIPSEHLADPQFLKTLVYQKLLPVICDHCHYSVESIFNNQEEIPDRKEYLRFFKELEEVYPNLDIQHVKLRNPKGCEHCHNNGIKGRTACAEIITLDNKMYDFIKNNQLDELSNYWHSLSDNDLSSPNMKGKRTMEHALYKMLKGSIDPLDIENSFMPPTYLKRK